MRTKDMDIHIRIRSELVEKIHKLAKIDRRKKTEVITIALENYFKSRKV